MPKILILCPSLSKYAGGTTTSIYSWASELVRADVDIEIKAICPRSDMPSVEIPESLADYCKLYEAKGISWSFSRELFHEVESKADSYGLVWVHGLWSSLTLFASRLSRKYSLPVIVSPHGMLSPEALRIKSLKKKLYWHLVEGKALRCVDAIHCLTNDEVACVSRLMPDCDAFAVPNGVTVGAAIQKTYAHRKSICFVGRIHPIKGLENLVGAVSRFSDVQLTIVGNGEPVYVASIKNRIRELQLESRIRLVGYLDNDGIDSVLRGSHFLVISSFSEGLSMSGVEALAASTPILTSKNCGLDQLEDYGAGVILDDNSVNSLAYGIAEMFNSDIEKMSRNANLFASVAFDSRSNAEKFLLKVKPMMNE